MSSETLIGHKKTDPPLNNFLSSEERQKILVDWNQTESDYPKNKTLHQLFEEQAEKTPQRIVLTFEDEFLTYQELNEKANQLARYLREQQVKPNSLIAICLEPSLEMFICILAILKVGAAYVPLDINYPEERLHYMLEDTQAAMLITQSQLSDRFHKTNTSLFDIDRILTAVSDYAKTNLVSTNHPDDLAYIIYTSGSSGKPKGVMITHRNVNNFIHWFGSALSIKGADIVDFSSSISFDFSVASTLFPMIRGAQIAICPELTKKDPDLYIDYLLKNKVTMIKLTPSYFRQLKEFVTAEQKFSELRFIIFGGETSYAKDVKEWLEKFPHHTILNEYGPTEATVATSWLIVDKNNINTFENDIPIGKPAFNTQLYILEAALEPVAIGKVGELYIGGVGVAKGYLNKHQITAERFIKNPFINNVHAKMYKTGDLGYFLPDGNIRFVGRIDNQIKIRGFRVETNEIEFHLNAYPAIKEAIVVAQKDNIDSSSETKLIAYFISKNHDLIPSTRELRHYLHQHLPDYMIPTVFMEVGSFPLTPNGKLNAKALPEPEVNLSHEYHSPQTVLEKKVEEIWSEVLNIKKISIDDDFFELGGHSLHAARIIYKLEKTTNKHIKLSDIYQFSTIKELAVIVGNAKEINENTQTIKTVKAEKSSKEWPLSEMQFLFWLIESFYPKTKVLNIVNRKRIIGKFDIEALQYAFECIFKKHPILSSYVSSYLPLQHLQSKVSFRIFEKDIQSLSAIEIDAELDSSLNYLEKNHNWKKGQPLITARLYSLAKNLSELQISLSHFISDDISTEIIFADLSTYYKNYKNNINMTIHPDSVQYKDYTLKERNNLSKNLKNDIPFWQEYLKDVNLFRFPLAEIISNPKNNVCTSYFLIPENELMSLQNFCNNNRLSISDSLCAAICLALSEYLDNDKSPYNNMAAITFIKSTRDNDVYDKIVGLFIRTNLIKVDLNGKPSFIELAKRIQKSMVITASYQSSPAIAKLAYALKTHWENKKIRSWMMKLVITLFVNIFKKLKLNSDVILMFGRIFLARTRQNFFINVNILNNFMLNERNKNHNLFGLPMEKVKCHQSDKMVNKGLLDITFYRDTEQQAYLILSSNLMPDFRQLIGNAIIKNIKVSDHGHKEEKNGLF